MSQLLTIAAPMRTARLELRPFVPGDAAALYDLQSRPEVTRYLYWEPRNHDEVAEALAKKQAWTTISQESDLINLAVTLADGGPFLGDVTLNYKSATHRQAEIGYMFLPNAQGHGYATEAVDVLVTLAFAQLHAHRVTAALDARNERSARLLERLGFRREAHLRENEWVKGEWTDEMIYALLAEEHRHRS